jgi:hypothetical protein
MEVSFIQFFIHSFLVFFLLCIFHRFFSNFPLKKSECKKRKKEEKNEILSQTKKVQL